VHEGDPVEIVTEIQIGKDAGLIVVGSRGNSVRSDSSWAASRKLAHHAPATC